MGKKEDEEDKKLIAEGLFILFVFVSIFMVFLIATLGWPLVLGGE